VNFSGSYVTTPIKYRFLLLLLRCNYDGYP
jgi:hypothetical protein